MTNFSIVFEFFGKFIKILEKKLFSQHSKAIVVFKDYVYTFLCGLICGDCYSGNSKTEKIMIKMIEIASYILP